MKKAGDVLKKLMDEISAKNSESSLASGVFPGWSSLVGVDIANHCTLVDIEDGFLKVEVDHPGWVQMLKLKEKKIVSQSSKKYSSLGIKGMKIFLRTSH